MAQDLLNQTEDKCDSTIRKYGAFVYETIDGGLHEPLPILGKNGQATGFSAPIYDIPNGAVIVADIQNHPEFYFQTSTGTYVGNSDSTNLDYGDIGALQSEAHGADSQFRMYIDHSGYMSEFDYVNNSTPIPSGSNPLSIDWSAVRGGFYPELGH